jgi:SAM-dependent MidA family methyltransferase
MQEWLYGADGYYAKYRDIGKSGDFYTAVSSSQFFGGSIANRLLRVIDEGFLPPDTTIVEIGAHKGYMLADIVQFIYTLRPSLLESLNFLIVESFSENIENQKRYFKESFGDIVKLTHVPKISDISLESAFVVANEIFDAFSCELIKDDKMLYLRDGEFVFDKMDPKIEEIAQRYGIFIGEVAVGYEEFGESLSRSIERFEFVTFDYGDDFKRDDFSIRVYHKHNSYPFFSLTKYVEDESQKPDISLEELYKKSDITFDVNFKYLKESLLKSGIESKLYKTQMAMLVEFGIIDLLDMLRKNSSDDIYFSELNRVKVLIDPAFMGERFKGVVFRKGER